MKTKQLNCPLSLKSMAEDGFFSGYASVFNVIDSQFDCIAPGAFSKTLREHTYGKGIKLLWQHHADEPIGAFTTIREDENGLYVEGYLLLDVQRGKEAYALLKSGALEGLSIGYSAVKYHFDEQRGVRILTEVNLWEISLVTFPANPEAGVTFVKEDTCDSRDDEVIEALQQSLDRALAILHNYN
jgi:HK97 family phage prohead protease